ncbi:MAG: ATP-binding protein, partial [Crocinitomicaceae bacterium]|nr:ATP-binding protein [Crocinitomicaceae bacterium]
MISNTIPLEKRIARLQFENPWWVGNQIQDVYKQMSKRLYFDVFYPFVTDLEIKRAVVLMGPRRVCKTVMMYHAIQELIDQQVSATQIIFVGIDNPIYMHLGLEDLLEISLKALGKKD